MSDFFSLFLLSLGLAADAFAVAVCKGLALRRRRFSDALIVGGWFGVFQAIMPIIGCLLGRLFSSAIYAVDHWISFALLTAIGMHMILEALSPQEAAASVSLAPSAMLIPALASSIDALAVGVVFSFSPSPELLPAALTIGVTTCLLSTLGVSVASAIGAAYKAKAEGFGGILLIFLGIKILITDLFCLSGWL
jgi:putative Mn2+ efflux pump MntP